jgi:hypothetical protein
MTAATARRSYRLVTERVMSPVLPGFGSTTIE